jgi:hypothetical protein
MPPSLRGVAAATRDQQVMTCVQGLALGVLDADVRAVSGSKLDFELAVAHALRRWSLIREFPALVGIKGDKLRLAGSAQVGETQVVRRGLA